MIANLMALRGLALIMPEPCFVLHVTYIVKTQMNVDPKLSLPSDSYFILT